MNAYPSNRVSGADCSTQAGVLRHPVFAIALIAGGLTISTARADNTYAQAEMTFWATADCDVDNCADASGSVFLSASCNTGDNCTVYPQPDFEVNCAPFPDEPVSLVLYDNEIDDCTGSGTESPYPVDLLAGPFSLTLTQWQSLVAGVGFIVADMGPLDAGGNAKGSGSTQKATSESIPGIPTLSEWAVVLMTLVLIVAGTILFGQFRRRASAT